MTSQYFFLKKTLCFQHGVSLCIPGWPEIHYVKHADLGYNEICYSLFPSPGLKVHPTISGEIKYILCFSQTRNFVDMNKFKRQKEFFSLTLWDAAEWIIIPLSPEE